MGTNLEMISELHAFKPQISKFHLYFAYKYYKFSNIRVTQSLKNPLKVTNSKQTQSTFTAAIYCTWFHFHSASRQSTFRTLEEACCDRRPLFWDKKWTATLQVSDVEHLPSQMLHESLSSQSLSDCAAVVASGRGMWCQSNRWVESNFLTPSMFMDTWL